MNRYTRVGNRTAANHGLRVFGEPVPGVWNKGTTSPPGNMQAAIKYNPRSRRQVRSHRLL